MLKRNGSPVLKGILVTLLTALLVGISGYPLMPDNRLFRETELPLNSVSFKPEAVLKQIDQVLFYFKKYGEKDPRAVSPGLLSSCNVTLNDVKATLIFCRDTLKEDLKKGGKLRLQDPVFLNNHFRALRWYPKPGNNDQKGRIRITKYAVFTITGQKKRDAVYRHALYTLPDDEKGMSLDEAQKNKGKLSRFKYTKQAVKAGAYDKGGAVPLVWINKDGLEKALMQGTICVRDDRNRKRFFNVSRGNDIPYDPKIDNPKNQERYWYFFEVKEPKGYGLDADSMVTIYPDAALAGDVTNLGLGKIMAIKGRKTRLGILADTGGAFNPGLDRLDYFTGVFGTVKEFWQKAKTIPEFAEVYILIKKKKGARSER